MNPVKLLNICLILWVTGSGACTKNTLNLPQPAPAIEGVYEAPNTRLPFLVQGEALRLNVKRITADSVELVVQAIVNGQPADSLSYQKAYVRQTFSYIATGQNCVGYLVELPVKTGIERLTMTCDEVNVFKYVYQPVAPKSNATIVKFKKR